MGCITVRLSGHLVLSVKCKHLEKMYVSLLSNSFINLSDLRITLMFGVSYSWVWGF